MKKFLTKFVESIENAPLTLASFLVAFLALILARLTVENTLGLFQEQSFFFFYFEFTHTFLFFLCSFFIMLPIVRYAGAESLRKATNTLLFGFLIILTPPIIDRLIMGSGNYWSFYEFDGLVGLFWRFFTLFGDTPDIGITYGVRIEVVLVTIALFLYAYLKSRLLRKSLLVALFSYTALFILGTFPSWITLAILAFDKGLLAVGSNDVAALFLSPERVLGRNLTDFRSVLNFKMSLFYAFFINFLSLSLIFQQYPAYFFAFLKNIRIPQIIYHGGLLFLGIMLASYFSQSPLEFSFFHVLGVIVLLIAVECAWLASVIVNDLYDTNIDVITNPSRPLIQNSIPRELYSIFGVVLFCASLLFAGIVSFSALLILLAYQALAWLYSAPPLRLKKYPGIATLMAAAAGIMVLIAGYVALTPTHSLAGLPLPILSYLFVAYLLSIPIKDFKDIAGDRKDHIYTLPVLLGETLAKQIISSLTLLLFTLSPLILHMRSLFLPALFCGALAFFSIQKGTSDETSFFSHRKLPRIILGITILYSIVIALFLM